MKRYALALIICAMPLPALADAYIMGAGRWTCAKAIQVFETGTPSESGQLFGWIMGFWSYATTERETKFVDVVEGAGGKAIADATISECRKAPADTLVYRVAQSMIRNTQ